MDNFKIMLQAMLDKVKSIANIKADIKAIESKLTRIKLRGTLDKTTTRKELNAKLNSIKTNKVKIDADITQAEKKIKKLGQQKGNATITPMVDNTQVVSGLKQAQKETKTLWDRFVGGVVGINLVRMAVQSVTKAIREAVVMAKELDTIKTNIQMVSGASGSDADSMMADYNAIAKDLSSTTQKVAESANEFLRMGESIENTNELIRSSQVLAQVGMIENSEATSYLISSLKGYKVAAEDSMDIVSKLTSVDLEAAVSAGGLAEALSKCSNVANNSGISMDSDVQKSMEAMKREELLRKHPYKIWQGKDEKWYTYLPDKEKGRRMIKRSTESGIENEVLSYWKKETENPTIKELFYEWMNKKLEYQDICIGTFNRYEKDFKRFFEDDSGFANARIHNVKSNEIIPFLRKAIVKYALTAKAYSNLRTLTYGIFKYAKEKEYISWSISQTINDMELPKKTFRKVIKEDDEEVFNDEEMIKLLKYLSDVPDILNLGIILMLCTGVRVGELVAIKWCDVIDNSIKIRRTEVSYKDSSGQNVYEIRDYPKTEAGVRTVFVPSEFSSIMGRLRLLSGQQEYIFWDKGHNIRAMQIRKRLYLVCKNAGIKKKSPHKLRKTYVSILLDNGIDKRLVQDVAGHAQISTSERNYHPDFPRRSTHTKMEARGLEPLTFRV